MMKMNKKVVLALLMVSLILFSSLVVLYPDNQNPEATASASVPKGEDYGYVLEINTKTAGSWTVNDVKVWDGTQYTSAKNATQYVLDSFWQFDENGLGPFNCFYAAINLVDYQIGSSSASNYNADYLTEAPLSSVAGHVAYVLDPNCFTKTLAGFSYTAAKYNIMLVIPTVYWYSDSSTVANYDFVFMSNNPDFFNIHRFSETISSTSYSFTSATKSSMIAYAHTYESSETALNWSTGTTYPYLALGVYEASQKTISISGTDKTCLVSQPSATGSTKTTISDHRTYAGNNTPATGSQYTIPNWFNWNLYQLMSYTTIGCLDAQYMVGAGVSSGNALTTGGCTSWFTPTSSTATTSHVCLYLEDAWGNRWEQIDSVCVDSTSQTVYLNNILVPGDATTSNTVSTGLVVGGSAGTNSQKRITTLSVGNMTDAGAGAWGIPRSYDDTSITQGASGINDSMWTSTAQVGGLFVGGSTSNGSSDGLAAWNSYDAVSCVIGNRGVRLAYVMTADAAVTDQITFYSWNGTAYSVANSVELSLGQSYRLPDAADISGYEFKGWTTTQGDYSTFIGKPNQLYTMTQNISLYPYYTSTADLLGAGFSVTAGGALDGIKALKPTTTISDTASNTMYVVWDQAGYSTAGYLNTVVGKLYYNGSEVYSETLYDYNSGSPASTIMTEDGTRVWYFSFDNNASSVAKNDGLYRLDIVHTTVAAPSTESTVLSSTVNVVFDSSVAGVGDFRVAAFTDANTGAMVQLESASSAGLLDGTLSLGGVYYYDTDGIRVYGAITYSNVKVGSTPMTSDWVTVTAGDLKDNVTFSLYHTTRTLYVYYAYAQYVYTLDGTNTMTTPGVYGIMY